MFAGLSHVGAAQPLSGMTAKDLAPSTPVVFPKCAPKVDGHTIQRDTSLVALLQGVHRPADLKLSHLEALGLHVQEDASLEKLLPDPSFLPPVEEWNALPAESLPVKNNASKRPLSNGKLSPGVETYRERQKELLTDNTAAFRTIRRIPSPACETSARLGNAYEFYKNLEYFSGFWDDTSLPSASSATPSQTSTQPPNPEPTTKPPLHHQTHLRTGNGSQLPADYRQNLLSAFVKLVAYDFGCNVSFARCEPRLQLTPSTPLSPPSHFTSAATFIYRTPTDASSARTGIVEGPVAALSARGTTVFATPADARLDLAREIIAVLLTAQQRAREHKREVCFGEDKWWTSKARWGGGPGGPIGREGEREEIAEDIALVQNQVARREIGDVVGDAKVKIGGISGGSPSSSGSGSSPGGTNKRPRKLKDGNMAIYQPYRKMAQPSSTWDRKARYSAIGKVPGSAHDDIFLVSALNHHICIMRARVPDALLRVLEGGEEESWERVDVWRSRWFDMFLKEERVAAMSVIWGMMAYLMREVEDDGSSSKGGRAERMDTS